MFLPWPLPAVLAWSSGWLWLLLLQWVMPPLWAVVVATVWCTLISLLGERLLWRRLMIVLGFPLSLMLTGMATVPQWVWLLPLGLLLAVYPLHAWRDAPVFPTPADALNLLPDHAWLEPGAEVLDAGCGMGDGLLALRQAYPLAQLHGIEWSRPLRWLCARRCPWAQVRQGDIWQEPWAHYALVYLFQRPESMARAWAKASAEMPPGTWLVSLEFAVPDVEPYTHYTLDGERPVWVYQIGYVDADDGNSSTQRARRTHRAQVAGRRAQVKGGSPASKRLP